MSVYAITSRFVCVPGRLTTEHAASSYGQAVFVDEQGQAWNAADILAVIPAALYQAAVGVYRGLIVGSWRDAAIVTDGAGAFDAIPAAWLDDVSYTGPADIVIRWYDRLDVDPGGTIAADDAEQMTAWIAWQAFQALEEGGG